MTTSGWSVLLVLADGRPAGRGDIEARAGAVPGNTIGDLNDVGLIERVAQGNYQITDTGRTALRELGEQVVELMRYLQQR